MEEGYHVPVFNLCLALIFFRFEIHLKDWYLFKNKERNETIEGSTYAINKNYSNIFRRYKFHLFLKVHF